MELRHLRYFVAVAETGNLSRAAEKLFVAQPPLSLQIRQLEEEIGAALFTRHPKGMRLTRAGEALLPEARDLLERAARLKQAGGRAPDAGSLALGYVPSAVSTVIPELVRALRQAHPGIEIRLHEMISDEQREALIHGRIDAGLARSQLRHPRLHKACALADPFFRAEIDNFAGVRCLFEARSGTKNGSAMRSGQQPLLFQLAEIGTNGGARYIKDVTHLRNSNFAFFPENTE